MRRSSSFFGRLLGEFGAKRKSKKRRGASPLNRGKLAFEPLEDRSLLSVCIWDGGSTVDSKWMTKENWAGDVAPQPGDILQFAGTQRTTNHNNFPAGTSFQSIEFSGNNFTLEGNSLTLTNGSSGLNGITVDSGVTGLAISLNIALADATTIATAADVSGSPALTISGILSGSNYYACRLDDGTRCKPYMLRPPCRADSTTAPVRGWNPGRDSLPSPPPARPRRRGSP